MTISVIHCAIVDLASIWQTAWVNLGDLTLPFNDEQTIPNVYLFDQNVHDIYENLQVYE